jgi:hypothetical protein
MQLSERPAYCGLGPWSWAAADGELKPATRNRIATRSDVMLHLLERASGSASATDPRLAPPRA